MLAGQLLHPYFPINKNLWTSTFVLFTGGFAMLLLALCYWAVDLRGWREVGDAVSCLRHERDLGLCARGACLGNQHRLSSFTILQWPPANVAWLDLRQVFRSARQPGECVAGLRRCFLSC